MTTDKRPLKERIEAVGGSCRKELREYGADYLAFDAEGRLVSRTLSGAWSWVLAMEAEQGVKQ